MAKRCRPLLREQQSLLLRLLYKQLARITHPLSSIGPGHLEQARIAVSVES
jgi:hypothetical protein